MKENCKMKNNRSKIHYRIGIVAVLILVVVVVLVFKSQGLGKETSAESSENSEKTMDSLAWHSLPTETATTEGLEAKTELVDSLGEKQGDKETARTSPLRTDVLALVNGKEITLAAFDSIFASLPPQIKEYFKDDKPGFLEELILRQLLLQEANRKKMQEQPEYKATANQNPEEEEQIMINLLLRELVVHVSISEQELKNFFDQYKDQLPNKDYESVREQLRPMAQEEKERQVAETYVNNLKSNAEITRNEKWIKEQKMFVADNPLIKALKLGQPVVADFGRGTCIPCKMMQPVLEKLEKEYEGKASILILDVGEYVPLARKYQIMMIPTQIFFDSAGKEVYRHQGFMPEEDIVAQLKKLGVE